MDIDSEIDYDIKITMKQRILLDDYFDRCFVMAILCNETYSYYSNLKNLIQFPTILMTSILTILNSTDINNTDNNYLKFLNIIVNAIVTFLISLSAAYRFSEKANQFRLYANKFTKLEHIIESKIKISPNELDTNFISACIQQYDKLLEELDLNFPEHIKNRIRNKYKTIKTLPLLINGISKNRNLVPLTPLYEKKTPFFNRNSSSFKNLNSSPVYENEKKIINNSSLVYENEKQNIIQEPSILNLDGNINFRDKPISLNELQDFLKIKKDSSLENSNKPSKNRSLDNIYTNIKDIKDIKDICRSKSCVDIYNFSFDDEEIMK